jgi:glycosyltransferase involved in cell wall biosynthesis
LADAYRDASVFLFTSLQDTSGNVVLEAMANGLPVVALNHQGVAEMMDATCAVPVPIGPRPLVVEDLARALLALRDDDLRERLSAGATARARQFTWERKGDLLRDLYGFDRASATERRPAWPIHES